MADFRGDLNCNQNVLKGPVIDPLASAPASPVAGQTYFNTASGFLYYWDGTQWVRVSGSTNAPYDYILLQDQKTSGTDPDSYTSGAWRQLDINTIAHDDTGSVVVSSNNFTLPAGTYEAAIRLPLPSTSTNVKLALYNSTDSTFIFYGMSCRTSNSMMCTATGKFTLTASKTLSARIWVTATTATSNATGISGVPEIYTEVELRKTS